MTRGRIRRVDLRVVYSLLAERLAGFDRYAVAIEQYLGRSAHE